MYNIYLPSKRVNIIVKFKSFGFIAALFYNTCCFAQPVINSFFPSSGNVGTIVTISGSNFSPTPTNNIVYFGSVKAVVGSATSTSLTVIVPSGATYQPVSVTTNNLTAFSSRRFILTFAGGGAITDYSFEDKIDKSIEENSNPVDISNADFDGDGKIDFVVVNNYEPYSISIYRNTSTVGAISFAPKVDYPTGIRPEYVAIGDIDGDGKKDIVVSTQFSISISVFRNTSTIGHISLDVRVDLPASNADYVAIGDLDKDGKPDIVVSNLAANTISIFKNTGNVGTISFNPFIDYPSGNFPTGVAIGDLDGDSYPDLAIINKLSNDITIYKNDGIRGIISFTQAPDNITVERPEKIILADIDDDGKPDMNIAGANSVSVYRNTGNIGYINFDYPVNYSNTSFLGLDMADIDGDGKPDFVAINSEVDLLSGQVDSLSIIRNISTVGTISFAPAANVKVGDNPNGVSIADMDGDNLPDLTTVNQTDNTISIIRNKVNGPNIISFAPAAAPEGATVIITGTNFTGVTLVSFGGVAQSFSVLSPTSISVILANAATGEVAVTSAIGTAKRNGFVLIYYPEIDSFTPLSGTAGTIVSIKGKGFDSTTSVKFGGVAAQSYSILSDTLISAVIGSGSSGDISITTIIGNATKGIFTFLSIPVPKVTSFIPDSGPIGTVVTISGINFNVSPSDNIVYFGATKANVLSASENSLTVAVPSGATYQPITVACNKLVTSSTKPFIVTYLTNPSFTPGSFTNVIRQDLFGGVRAPIKGGDLDGDGKTDLVFGYGADYQLNYISLMLNNSTAGNFSLADEIKINSPYYPYNIAIGDINGDGKLDLITANVFSFSVIKNTSVIGSLSFETSIEINTGTGSKNDIFISDIDLDGKQDVIVANSTDDNILIFRNTTVGDVISFAPVVTYLAGDGPISLVVDDLNNDGKPEIITANRNSETFSIFKNKCTPGLISFANKLDISSGGLAECVRTGDLDNDGRKDIIIANGGSGTMSLFRNSTVDSTIAFSPGLDFIVSERFNDCVAIGDLNGDGMLDIVASDSYLHDLGVFRNKSTPGNFSFSNMVRYRVEPYAAPSVFLGDIDGDNKTDIVGGAVAGYAFFGNMVGEPKTIPSGINPVTGKIISRVTIDPVVNTYNGFPYVQRHYDIEPEENPSTATAFVSLYFTQEEFNNYNSFIGHGADLPTSSLDTIKRANIRIFQYHGFSATSLPGSYPGGSVEIDPVDSNIIWNSSADCWEVKFEVDGFSGFFISSAGNNILPLTLINFTGTLSGNTAKLFWSTTNEVNFNHFELERSYDGIGFSRIGIIPGIESGSGNHYYHFDDLLNTTGIYYYRLLILDNDGHSKYSQIITITSSSKLNAAIRISPNPAQEFITINFPKVASKADLRIINSQGQVVKSIILSANSTQSVLEIRGLPAGLYTLLWTFKDDRLSQLFLKK